MIGAKRLLPVTLCDEIHNPEKTAKRWLDTVNKLDVLKLEVKLSKVEQTEIRDKKKLFKRISMDSFEFFRSKSSIDLFL